MIVENQNNKWRISIYQQYGVQRLGDELSLCETDRINRIDREDEKRELDQFLLSDIESKITCSYMKLFEEEFNISMEVIDQSALDIEQQQQQQLNKEEEEEEKKEDGKFTFSNIAPESKFSLRYRLEGDKFQPAWREGSSVKLKDFLRGQLVPLHVRDWIPLVVLYEKKEIGIGVDMVKEVDSIKEDKHEYKNAEYENAAPE